MIEIWQEILQRDQIGVHDNFLELGGHSLLATKVLARVRTRLNRTIPLRTLCEHPTVVGLVTTLEQAKHPINSGESDNLTTLLDSIDSLSDEEAQSLLEQENQDQRS